MSFACQVPAALTVTGMAPHCGEMPTQLSNSSTSGGFTAFQSGGNLLLCSEAFGFLKTFDVTGDGFVLVHQVGSPAGDVWFTYSPVANEWVGVYRDSPSGGVKYVSYSMVLTLMNTSPAQNLFNLLNGSNIIASTSTPMVYVSTADGAASYNAVARTLGLVHKWLVNGGNGGFALRSSTDVVGGEPDYLFCNLRPRVAVVNGGTMAEVASITLPNPYGTIDTFGGGYSPDSDTVYVIGTDGGPDGGDVIWLIDGETHTLITTLRLGSNHMRNGMAGLGNPSAYDAATHQVYIGFTGLSNANQGVFVICSDTNTFIGYIDLHASLDNPFGVSYDDLNQRIFVGTNGNHIRKFGFP